MRQRARAERTVRARLCAQPVSVGAAHSCSTCCHLLQQHRAAILHPGCKNGATAANCSTTVAPLGPTCALASSIKLPAMITALQAACAGLNAPLGQRGSPAQMSQHSLGHWARHACYTLWHQHTQWGRYCDLAHLLHTVPVRTLQTALRRVARLLERHCYKDPGS